MSCRAGITTRPKDRKMEWKQDYPNMRNWQVFGPFSTREKAQEWEDRQPCVKHPGGNDPDTRGAEWYGYRFDY